MKNGLLFAILLLAATAATAQPDKKTAPALNSFLNTEFMLKFRDLRIECESNVLQIQAADMHMDPKAVFRMRAAYDQTATRSNQLLENIKQDFLNDKKLKSIAEFPEMYSDGMRFKLQEISDYYNTHFMQALADAGPAGDEIDGAAFLLLFVELVGLANGLTRYFSDIRREARHYNEKYLHEHLVKPYRWQYWDELSGSGSKYEQYDRQPELVQPDASRQDQIEQRLLRVNETATQMKTNQAAPPPQDWQYTEPEPTDVPAEDPDNTDPDWSPFGTKAKKPGADPKKPDEKTESSPVTKKPLEAAKKKKEDQ